MGLFSGSKSSTSNNTTNNNYDQRSVLDAGGGIIGDGNDWASNSNNAYALNSNNRTSNTSTNTSTQVDASQSFTDWSNRSTAYTDSRDQSVMQSFVTNSDNRNITDGGAFDIVRNVADGIGRIGLAQVDTARALADRADTTSAGAMSFAMRAQQDAAGFNEAAASQAFDLARSGSAQAFESSGAALNFARETFGDVLSMARDVVGQAGTQARTAADTAAGAYQSAADTSTGNKTLIYAGLAVLAVAAVAYAFKG